MEMVRLKFQVLTSRVIWSQRRRFIRNNNLAFLSQLSKSSPNSGGPGGSQEQEESGRKSDEELRSLILNSALVHVNERGWNLTAIQKGAGDLGLSPEVANSFSPFDLVSHFVGRSNSELEKHLSTSSPTPPSLQEALKWRLERVIPYASKYHEALAWVARPQHSPESLKLILLLSDSLAYHCLKDRSSDMSWYGKRLGIASIYAATELCLVQDSSQGHVKTWEFLNRRVKDYEGLAKGGLSIPAGFFSIGLITLGNILGRNASR